MAGMGGRVLVAVLVLLGAAIACYPSAASWQSARRQAAVSAAHIRATEQIGPDEQAGVLDAARDYNARLAAGAAPDSDEYTGLLNPAGDGIMGRILIESLDVDLPIFHDDTDDILARGAGHIPFTSLPVGGESTHAAITAHRGYPLSVMFTHVDRMRTGDTFDLLVAGEHLRYQVDQIKVVSPTDASDLAIVDGADYVTLYTCTPIGLNTHRLLIRGKRIPVPADEPDVAASDPAEVVGFPWFAPVLGAVALAGVVFVVAPALRRPGRHAARAHGRE